MNGLYLSKYLLPTLEVFGFRSSVSFGKSDVSVLPTNSLESELDSKELSSSFNSLLLAAAHLIIFVWCPFIFLAFAKDISNFRYFSMNYLWIILNLNTSPGWWNLGPIGIRNNKSRGFLVSNMYNLSTSKVIYAVLGPKCLRFQFFLVAWSGTMILTPLAANVLQNPFCNTVQKAWDWDCEVQVDWRVRPEQDRGISSWFDWRQSGIGLSDITK